MRYYCTKKKKVLVLINHAGPVMVDLNDTAVMYGEFQGGPQLAPPDAERRQSLGQL